MSKLKQILILLGYTLLVSITAYYTGSDQEKYVQLNFIIINVVAILGGVFTLRLLGNKLNVSILSITALVAYLIWLTSIIIDPYRVPTYQLSLIITSTLLFSVLFTSYFNESIATRFFVLMFTGIVLRLKGIFYDIFVDIFQIKITSNATSNLWNIVKAGLLFIVIGLPVVLVVSGLLAGVSNEFKNVLDQLLKLLPTNFGQLIISGITGVYFLSEIYLLLNFKKYSETLSKIKIETSSLEINKTILRATSITLVILNIFYMIFIYLDISQDLLSTKQLLLDKGIRTYSEFAVDRFWNLIMVGLINLFMIYIVTKPFHLLNKSNSSILRPFVLTNISLISIATCVLVISTNQRLNLYISGYGYTETRLLAQSFLPILIMILVLVLSGIFTTQLREKLYQLSIGLFLLFLAVFNILPATYIVTKINYELAKQDKIEEFDPLYVAEEYARYGLKCPEAGSYYYTTSPAEIKPEGVFVAVEMLKDDNKVLTQKEKDCIATGLKYYYKSIDATYNTVKGDYDVSVYNDNPEDKMKFNLTELLVKDFLEKNKSVYE